MRFVKQRSLLAIGLCMVLSLHAQPKREFRASWLTTAWAIDWPNPHSQASKDGQLKQQQNLISLLKYHSRANLNAVFFQVRSFSDAMYNSKYEPWSQYLTGTRGGEPTYDPLQLLIDSAHARGIEVHAWLNPYRYASSDATYGKNHPKDYHNTHPDWLVNCGGITILNPSLPEVREQICKVVADIVENYDVDGIIFDDYFHQDGYQNSYDEAQYQATGNGMSRADWRRAQNNLMVRMVNDTIKAIKPWVKFGIGPAGVAGKANTSAPVYGVEPCPTPASDWQYNGIYADPLAWYNEHTIDYMAPQIYWTISSWSNYDVICKWWSDMACHFNRHMYVSHSLSAMVSDNVSASSGQFHPSEIAAQTELNRLYDRMDAPGSCWYGFSTGVGTANFLDYIATNVNSRPAVVPQMTWLATDECVYVSNIRLEGNILKWDAPKENLRYVVYQIPNAELNQHAATASQHLLGTSYSTNFKVNNKFALDASIPCTYAVAVLDRFGNEYPARTMDNTSWGKSPVAKITYPAHNAHAIVPCNVSWNKVKDADSYFVQMSKSADFSTLDYEYEVTDTTFYLGKVYWLDSDGTYFWRVRTRSMNKEDSYTEVHAFDASYFRMQYPAEGDTCDFVKPTMVCDSIAYGNVVYTFEIATASSFSKDEVVHVGTSATHRYTLPIDLMASRIYYVRATATFSGMNVMTDATKFRTMAQYVPVPVITSPKNGTHIAGDEVTVTWQEQPSSGFQVEFCTKDNFPPRSTKTQRIDDPNVFSCTKAGLTAGTWYIRVLAAAEGGYTEPSEVVTVYMGSAADVDNVSVESSPTKVVENGQVIIYRNGKRYNVLGNTAQ